MIMGGSRQEPDMSDNTSDAAVAPMITAMLVKFPVVGAQDVSVVRELESVVATLSARFPACIREDVGDLVYGTYERLASTAKITAHLIPLTLNRARADLEKQLSSSPVSLAPTT